MDIVDLAQETVPSSYSGIHSIQGEAMPEKLDLRKPEDRAKAGLPPRTSAKGPRGPQNAPGRKPGTPVTRQTKTDYKAGIEGLLQLAAFGVSFSAPYDAAAIVYHSTPIAIALNDLAQVKPEVARVLDKILAAGPYGAVLSAVVPLIVQLLTNHGKAPVGMLGSVEPAKLVA